MARIEGYKEVGVPALCAGAKRVVPWVGRNAVLNGRSEYFGFFPKQIDDSADHLAPDLQPLKDFLVLRKYLFGDKPSEGCAFHPGPQEQSTRIGGRYGADAKPGETGNQNRCVDYTSRPSCARCCQRR